MVLKAMVSESMFFSLSLMMAVFPVPAVTPHGQRHHIEALSVLGQMISCKCNSASDVPNAEVKHKGSYMTQHTQFTGDLHVQVLVTHTSSCRGCAQTSGWSHSLFVSLLMQRHVAELVS